MENGFGAAALALLGIAVVFALGLLPHTALDLAALHTWQYVYLFAVGAFTITAMVLLGISGSMLLLILGAYLPVITAVRELLHLNLAVLPGVIVFGLGVLSGIAGKCRSAAQGAAPVLRPDGVLRARTDARFSARYRHGPDRSRAAESRAVAIGFQSARLHRRRGGAGRSGSAQDVPSRPQGGETHAARPKYDAEQGRGCACASPEAVPLAPRCVKHDLAAFG